MEDELSGALTLAFSMLTAGADGLKAYLTAGAQSVLQKNLCWEW